MLEARQTDRKPAWKLGIDASKVVFLFKRAMLIHFESFQLPQAIRVRLSCDVVGIRELPGDLEVAKACSEPSKGQRP